MEILSKIWTAFKNFQYKRTAAVIILAISTIVYRYSDDGTKLQSITKYISLTFFIGLMLYIYAAACRGIYNLWKDDGSKGLATFFGVILAGMTGLIIWLLFFHVPQE